MGWRNSKSIELSMIRLWSQIGRPVVRECDTRMRDPKCGRDCQQDGAVVFHGEYRSSELNKSIVTSIIYRNVRRWFMAKR